MNKTSSFVVKDLLQHGIVQEGGKRIMDRVGWTEYFYHQNRIHFLSERKKKGCSKKYFQKLY